MYLVGIDMVFLEEVDDVLSHPVVASLADERGIDARPAERDDAIEYGTSRHGSYGLLVLENDVEHSFSYSYNFTHVISLFGFAKLGKILQL